MTGSGPRPPGRSRRPPGASWWRRGRRRSRCGRSRGEMGMTAPALYRYFGSREDLLRHVCGDIFTRDRHRHPGRRDPGGRAGQRRRRGGQADRRVPASSATGRSRTGRSSACSSAPRCPGWSRCTTTRSTSARGLRRLLMALFLETVAAAPVPGPAPTTRSIPGLWRSWAATVDGLGSDLPAGAVPHLPALLGAALRHGQPGGLRHLHFALDDAAPLFEYHPGRARRAWSASTTRFPASDPAATARPPSRDPA